VLTLLRELFLLAAALLPAGALGAQPARDSALAVLGLAAAVSVLGLVNARRVARVVTVNVPLAGLPPALEGFRIVQLSDIHIGHTIKRPYLQALVDRANALKPDLIALTGDLVDGSVPRLCEHTAPLAQLRARHGTYSVTGNHEYYSGADSWIAEWRRLGLVPLLNEHRVIRHDGAALLVAGVTDYSAHRFDRRQASDPAAALAGAPAGAVKLLLAHQPRSAVAAERAGFDLQLSGHTHGGQFLPWTWFVPLQQPFVAGLARLGRLLVYTSRGSGYWGPPLRFGAPSEITLLILRHG
jgi:predicted MPP superfamily phosphohydrolase